MTKASGLGDNFYIDQYNLSGDVGSLSSIHGGNSPLEVTGIDKAAYERIGGKRDGGMSFSTFFNTAAGQAHPALSALPTGSVIMSYFRGAALGNDAACLVARQIGYDGTRADDGGFTFAVEGQADGFGLEWGVQATAGVRTDAEATAAADVSPIDIGAAGTYGLQAYLHIFSLGSGTPTIKLQTSNDDGESDEYADLTDGAFSITEAGSERIAVSGDVEQYIKVVTEGTFTDLAFAVMVNVNSSAVTF